jgi:DNA mismatch repair protein MutS
MSTPIRRQYLSIKRQYPDVIVFFRLGDFYETFDDDARVAASVLDITLTSREMGRGQRVPMAGIPCHAAESYIGRLVAAGYKVAVCEQVGQPDGRHLVERRVTRVVTPGTVTDPALLDAGRNTYIAAALVEGDRAGLAVADLSTGEFAVTEVATERPEEAVAALQRELLRLAPAEILRPAADPGHSLDPLSQAIPDSAYVTPTDPRVWRLQAAERALREHFEVETLEAFGCAGKPLAIRAAGALLQYLRETQIGSLAQIVDLSTYSLERFMTLDAQTRRNLELTESSRGDRRHALLAILDQTRTPMGARLLRRWLGQPLLDLDEIRERQRRVGGLVREALSRARLRESLAHVHDLERLINRVVLSVAGPRELAGLERSLSILPALAEALVPVPELAELAAFPDCGDLVRLIRAALVDDPPATFGQAPVIRPGFNPELDSLRSVSREARAWIAGLEQVERARTGIKSLKVGYNKVFGYYIEVSNANRALVPPEYQRKQTLVGAERYVTPELKEYESRVLRAEERLTELEAEVYRRLLAEVAAAADRVRQIGRQLAQLDVLASLAEVAVRHRYVCPEVDGSTVIEIVRGRHPVVEAALEPGGFVPNDTLLDTGDQQIVILTGPNMAGKSTYLRQVALIVLLAQVGSFVPADRARIGLVDRIFTRIGAQDDIASGQSTFMVEMVETATILHHATRRSLVVLDEIGRGTSTYDGLAIARAVVEHLHNSSRLGCRTLFATHYHELTALERVLPRVRNFRVDVLEDGERVVFLHRVVPGGADKSYGIYVAQIAGLPRAVVRRAQEILAALEAGQRGEQQRRREALEREPPLAVQLTLFAPPHPVLEELKRLEVQALSPIEALTTLYELQRRVREDRS